MTNSETVKIVTMIVLAYPTFESMQKNETIKSMAALWSKFFKDDEVHYVEMAVIKHISVNKFPPSIAEIREQMVQLLHPEIISPDIAWAAVNDLIISHGEFGSPDLYNVLPAPIARVVETIGWSSLYQMHRGHYAGNKGGMDRVAFMDLYKPVYAREMEKAMLPPALNKEIQCKKTEIADKTLKMLTDARKKRVEEEHKYDFLTRRNNERLYDRDRQEIGGCK